MKPLVWVAALVAVGGLLWWMQRSADDAKPRTAPDAGLNRVLVPTPLPGLDAGVVRPIADARVPDAAIDADYVRQRGTFGMPVTLVEQAISKDVLGEFWKREPGPTPVFRNKRDVVLKMTVEDGKVVGGRIDFPKTGATADLQGASPLLTGTMCALSPAGYEQADVSKGQARAGKFECHGKEIWYRGEVSFEGGPGHPVWFEYRNEAF